MLATDRKLPVTGGAEKRSYVRDIFTAIAPRYDLLNHLLSLNVDRRWRRRAVRRLGWERASDGRYLDLCAGTLDLAAALAREPGFRGRVIGADFVLPMLELGRRKSDRVLPVNADALELPFADATFDGVTVGFGVRNLADLDAGLAEAARVLKPGGRLVILEFATPRRQPLRALYLFYFRRVLPWIGRLVSKHTSAYTYLPESVLAFPEPDALAERMRGHGFGEVGYELLVGGICALHVGARSGGRGAGGSPP
ncbi:MAG TPA: bifunctional demethylmenaquinone methyltransferase/2-methoxy-6-polyprenyl-1,4-benzoquinol methylase UbiE [Gemmatimonadales bacterium]|nr:bifunctional demethylmenaquinone methyltransferase/2-methoxy-6-polyprenyl-1,4-benzoquinol methylase UbiE [Gemmatimonadales bacterium]